MNLNARLAARPSRSPKALLASAAVGYGLGMMPSAELVVRAWGSPVDLRREGSRNPGASNVAKLVGRKAGAVVGLADTAKAGVAGLVGAALGGPTGANLAASAAVVGHCYPARPGVSGGKGMATSFGQMLVTFPAYLPVDLGVGAAMASSSRWKDNPTASAVAVCGAWTALASLWWRRQWPNLWGPAPTAALPVAAAVSSAVIVSRFVQSPDASRFPVEDS